MKSNNVLKNIVAICTVFILVAGFQVSANGSSISSLETSLGMKATNTGPCASRGCDGQPVYCTSYTVFEVGKIIVTRHCDGEKAGPAEVEVNWLSSIIMTKT